MNQSPDIFLRRSKFTSSIFIRLCIPMPVGRDGGWNSKVIKISHYGKLEFFSPSKYAVRILFTFQSEREEWGQWRSAKKRGSEGEGETRRRVEWKGGGEKKPVSPLSMPEARSVGSGFSQGKRIRGWFLK